MRNKIARIARTVAVALAIAAGITACGTDTPASDAPDTTVCYWSASNGVWLSEYSASGYCTFGAPLDTETPEWNRIR